MSGNSEIPCSFCGKWNLDARSFSCNPYACPKLTEWLLKYTKIKPIKTKKVAVLPLPVQYIV